MSTRTRPTVTQYTPEDEYYEQSEGAGWVLFAGIMLAMLAGLNMIYGIAAVGNSTFFVNDAKFILSDLNTWGWVLIVIAVVQGLTAVGVVLQTKGVRWIGVAIAALNAIAQMFFIAAYPILSLTLFALDILVIYGLAVHGARLNRAA